jgi:diacylglycerol kinase
VTGSVPLSFGGRSRSVRNAWRGLVMVVRSQHNAWIHAFATVGVVAAGAYFRVALTEWALLTIAIVGVWSGEAFNTAIEALGDAVSQSHHPLVGRAKDAAAGAVLASSIGAIVIGALIFAPRIASRF